MILRLLITNILHIRITTKIYVSAKLLQNLRASKFTKKFKQIKRPRAF